MSDQTLARFKTKEVVVKDGRRGQSSMHREASTPLILLMAVTGVVLLFATLWLVLAGGEVAGPRLGLLSQFFPGYTVTAGGSLVGLGWGFAAGFAAGWTFALFRNAAVFFQVAVLRRRAELRVLRRILDHV